MYEQDVRWKLHLVAPPEQVSDMIATDSGRAKFWVEESLEADGKMTLRFLGEPEPLTFTILEKMPPSRFSFHYFGNTTVLFELQSDGHGGTDLLLTEVNFPSREYWQPNYAGWVSVLMNLKAVVEFGVDLRNHDPKRTWNDGYCEN